MSRVLLCHNRYETREEIADREYRKELAADLAAMRSQARTKDEKTYVAFMERSIRARNFQEELQAVRTSDGVAQYEAWVLARAYFLSNHGVCGIVQLPVRDGDRWDVLMLVGTAAVPHRVSIAVADGTAAVRRP